MNYSTVLRCPSRFTFSSRFALSPSSRIPGPGIAGSGGRAIKPRAGHLTLGLSRNVSAFSIPPVASQRNDQATCKSAIGVGKLLRWNNHNMKSKHFSKGFCDFINNDNTNKFTHENHSMHNMCLEKITNSRIYDFQYACRVPLHTCNRCFTTSACLNSSQRKRRLKLEETRRKAKVVKESVEETVREWKEDIVFTIPNALTTMRIALTPLLGYLVVNESYSWACGIFVFAGVTDLLDGYIARNFPGQASALGSYLDPLADKLLVSVLFLSLTVVDLIPVPLTALVILRDALLIMAAFYIRYSTLPPPKTLKRYFDVTHATAQLHPTLISKLNTAVQLVLVATSLGAPVFGYVDHLAMHALWYLTAGTTIASGITYMFAKDTVSILRQTRKIKK